MTTDQPHSKRESGDDRRLAIAAAARAIILEKGLEGLRTRDIAARVGINIATLHYHVPSKEALVALVAESIRYDFRDQALRHPRDGKTALQKLHLEFNDFRETMRDMPDLVIVLTELVARSRRDPVIAGIMTPIYEFWRNQFVDIFRLGIADGSFRADTDAEAAALIIAGALSDCWRRPNPGSPRLEQMLAELERAFAPYPSSSQGSL
ncbi:TetR/AcrR family transcriptional regulator [Devosia beringensis]|uniref:TetR/AcrR family transcriptional regulator n=1 Tax=Devosia beringensis TaxID=2657486 RepID=UPI00186B94BB|nr:TetR/AcrR family transcriptional regulator [Devosia beringensis]